VGQNLLSGRSLGLAAECWQLGRLGVKGSGRPPGPMVNMKKELAMPISARRRRARDVWRERAKNEVTSRRRIGN
jgi:hypothetical protein